MELEELPAVKGMNEVIDQFRSKPNPRAKLPSIFKREQAILSQMKKDEDNKAELYRTMKNYKFTADGKLRTNLKEAPKYLKTTFPEAEFNEDYIYVEKLTDHRVKTSSVAKRLYFNAPSINEIRKSGQHNFLMKAIKDKKTYGLALI